MAENLLDRYEQFMNPGLARVFRFTGIDSVEDHGLGCLVWDESGRAFIDCAGGYGVFNQGYQHPRIVSAAHRQLDKMGISSHVLESRPSVDLAEMLARVTPGDLQYSFFCNSGTEAVEGALKFARAATGRTQIISTVGAFHGKTYGSLSVSGRRLYQEPFEPLVPDVIRVPYGDAKAVAAVISKDTAAVIIEPIQGEGGVVVPPDTYLPELRHLCDVHGALLIVDEVQTGMGRTGHLFAVEHSQVVPDLLCLAKALGGGLVPIGAIVGRPNAWQFFESSPLIHTSTFGGNPLASAVALEALTVTIEEELPERALRLGQYFLDALKGLQQRYPRAITEVRGRGLMIGIEVVGAGVGGALISELFQRQVLVVYTLNNEKVIRLMPPLVITQDQLDTVLARLDAALAAIYPNIDDLVD